MPICPDCGKTFSGISFGARPATECSACRKAKDESAAAAPNIPHAAAPSIRYSLALPPVTLTIMVANALVYVAMTLSGASWTDPNVMDAVKWGADFGPLTLNSDGWRLFTSTFVHFGIIHIALNMWCLWNLGTTLEPLMGRKVFSVVYVASGLAASLTSVAWNPWRVSAGASGAIFGVAGALVSYLALKKTPMDGYLVKRNLKSLGFFIFYNLLYGVRGGVDNSAHLGGLVAGLVLGAAIPPMMRVSAGPQYIPVGPPDGSREAEEESRTNRAALAIAVVSAIVLVVGFAVLRAQKLGVARYGAAVKLIKAGGPDQAVARLQESVKLDPQASLAQAMLGELQLRLENPGAAVTPLEAAAKIEPYSYGVQHNLALAYLGAGRPSDAVSLASSSILSQDEAFQAAKPSDRGAWWGTFYIRGLAEGQVSDFTAATNDFRSMVSANLHPDEAKTALAQLQSAQAVNRTPHLEIPYDQLVMQSKYWPLYP